MSPRLSADGLRDGLPFHCATDIDEVIPDHTEGLRPCRRLTALMRPSHPVRHFWPLRNQRFFCSRLRSGLFVLRFGMQTRLCGLPHRKGPEKIAKIANQQSKPVKGAFES